MRGPRGKRFAMTVAAISVVSLVAAAAVLRAPLLERWYLRQLERGAEDDRAAAAEWLARRQCRAAVPLLVDELIRFSSKHELRSWGPSAPSGDSRSWWDRCWPGRALAAMGTPAVEGLLPLLQSGEAKVHIPAMEVLYRMGPPAAPGLAMALEGGLQVRWQAVHVLRRIGPGAEAAGPALVNQFREKGYTVHLCDVFRCLAEVYPQGLREAVDLAQEGLRPVLVSHLKLDGGPRTSDAVVRFLEDLEGHSSPLVRDSARRILGVRQPARSPMKDVPKELLVPEGLTR